MIRGSYPMINIILGKGFPKTTMNKMRTSISHKIPRYTEPRENHILKHFQGGLSISALSRYGLYPLSDIIYSNKNMSISLRRRKRTHKIKSPAVEWFNKNRITHRHFIASRNITNSLTLITSQNKLS